MPELFVDENIARAKTLDTAFYTSEKYFEAAKEKIFSRCWQYIGHSGFLNETGNCFPLNVLPGYLDEPLLLTRDGDKKIHCLSNVCTHRGNIIIYEPCHAANLRCKYHGRLFHLDGRFKSMPEFKEVENFPSEEDNLHKLPVFNWSNFLFTSLSPEFPAEAFFSEMMERVGWLPLQDFVFRPELTKEYHVDANWALYCENYLEGFHIPFVHAELNAMIDYGNYSTELFRYCSLQLGIAKDDEDCFELPSTSRDHGKNIAAYYFWVFPNMMFNFYPWGLSVNIVQPTSVSDTRVLFLSFVWKEEKRSVGAGADLDKVELEDEEIVQNVQKGIRSRFYNHGRYSVTREQGTHHFHRLISGFMNTYPSAGSG